MNAEWIDFLKINNASVINDSEILFTDSQHAITDHIAAVPTLSILKITGADVAHFLQGQLTCNINDLSDSNSFFAAFCNAKGRTISTLLIVKNLDSYLLLIPLELIDVVSKKLQMYILRSDVQIQNVTNELCLLGITTTNNELLPNPPKIDFATNNSSEIVIKLPSNDLRYLIISSAKQAIILWTQLTQDKNVKAASSTSWNYQDISAGIAWLSLATTEEYIPQMLNIDKLGGISFNKGCYTGQEIIARTHYLGKTKRELFLAECEITAMLDSENKIFSEHKQDSLGKIISFQKYGQKLRFLIVIPVTAAELNGLKLDNQAQNKINILVFQ